MQNNDTLSQEYFNAIIESGGGNGFLWKKQTTIT